MGIGQFEKKCDGTLKSVLSNRPLFDNSSRHRTYAREIQSKETPPSRGGLEAPISIFLRNSEQDRMVNRSKGFEISKRKNGCGVSESKDIRGLLNRRTPME